MGQPVAVVEKPSSIPGVVRLEANRSLTGQGHERFSSAADAVGHRPAAELARRLFATGRVESVHVLSNVVTVNLLRGYTADGLRPVLRDLYQYWQPGMEPPAFDDTASADEPAAAASGGGDGAAASGPEAEYLRRIPAHLVERSRSAMTRWKAAHGG